MLEFLEKINNIKIQHALNEGEFTILNTKYKSDGYCKENNTIYEFHGDYWHGNSKIFNPNDNEIENVNDEDLSGITIAEIINNLKKKLSINDLIIENKNKNKNNFTLIENNP